MKDIRNNNTANAFSKTSLTTFILFKIVMLFSTCLKTLKKIFFIFCVYIILKKKKNERIFCFVAVTEIMTYNINMINNITKSLNLKYHIDR